MLVVSKVVIDILLLTSVIVLVATDLVCRVWVLPHTVSLQCLFNDLIFLNFFLHNKQLYVIKNFSISSSLSKQWYTLRKCVLSKLGYLKIILHLLIR